MKELKKEQKTNNSIEKALPKNELDENFLKSKIKYVNKFLCYNENLLPKKFLLRKHRFRVYKHNKKHKSQNKMNTQKEGKWTLKEHILFLQGLEKFGINWRKISEKVETREYKQVRSHAQKFYEKLKGYKDTELKIDFTSENINNFIDMINHIKSINENYNIVTVFLYLSEICKPKRTLNKKDKDNNINDILCEDITKNIINNCDIYHNNNEKNKKYINNNNNLNKSHDNNNFTKNSNYFNEINNLVPLEGVHLNNDITSTFINNDTLQVIPYNNMVLYNKYFINNAPINLIDKFSLLDGSNNLEFGKIENYKDNF